MEIAKELQSKPFPQSTPPLETLEYVGTCIQARAGGDYYDFLDLGAGRVGFVLADISGKEMPPALLMANLQAIFRNQDAVALNDPEGLLRSVNRLLYQSTATNHHATLFFAIYDDANRQLTYANCGHNPPVLLRANGDVERLKGTAAVIEPFDKAASSVCETRLRPGDTLVIFTDGVTGALRGKAEEFGEERLIETIRANAREPAFGILDATVEAVQAFNGGSQSDDLTLIVARMLPDWQSVREIVEDLIAYLESVSDDETDKAREAADILRRRLGNPEEPRDTRSFQYDLGGKGIHDWAWNPTNEKRITTITDRYWDFFVSKKKRFVVHERGLPN